MSSGSIAKSGTTPQGPRPTDTAAKAPAKSGDKAVVSAMYKYGQLRALWTTVVAFTTLYNVLIIPFRICFSIETSIALLIVDALLDAVLIADIAIQSKSPFESDGLIVYDKKRILIHYAKTWLVVDVLASIPIDFIQIIPAIGLNPLVRVNKLFRVSHLLDYVDLLEKYSGLNPSLVRILKFTAAILFMSHYVACAWFLLIYLEGSDSENWTSNPNFLKQDLEFQYLAALYWALVSMTGYGGPYPVTDAETTFSLFVVLIGVAVYATIIGTVGSLVTNLDSSASSFRQKMDTINDYMKYRRLPEDLQARVRSYYTYLWKSRKGLDETKVLEDLPQYLRMEVSLSLNRDIIQKVPLFQGADPQFISTIVMSMRPRVSLPSSYIVKKGEIGKEMFFISRGEVEVVNDDGTIVYARLKEGSFFGEIALVTSGKRTASVRAATYCDLFVLNKQDFDEVLADFPEQARAILQAAEARYNLIRKNDQDEEKKVLAKAESIRSASDDGKDNDSPSAPPSSNQSSASLTRKQSSIRNVSFKQLRDQAVAQKANDSAKEKEKTDVDKNEQKPQEGAQLASTSSMRRQQSVIRDPSKKSMGLFQAVVLPGRSKPPRGPADSSVSKDEMQDDPSDSPQMVRASSSAASMPNAVHEEGSGSNGQKPSGSEVEYVDGDSNRGSEHGSSQLDLNGMPSLGDQEDE